MFVLLIFLGMMESAVLTVHAHYEQWSFVNGGAEVCSIVNVEFSPNLKLVCLRPVKGRYVSLTIEGIFNKYVHIRNMTIYSKCKYICSFKC